MTATGAKPTVFATPAAWRRWLAANHAKADALLVGFWKRDAGKPSITWPESVDEALCYGWIDGVRRRIDEASYSIRFTPRKPGSTWSRTNIARMEALSAEGRVKPAGHAAYAARREAKSVIYSYEQGAVEMPAAFLAAFKRRRVAWRFFDEQPASYRKMATWWVASAKREETRQRRFDALVEASSRAERLPQFDGRKPRG